MSKKRHGAERFATKLRQIEQAKRFKALGQERARLARPVADLAEGNLWGAIDVGMASWRSISSVRRLFV